MLKFIKYMWKATDDRNLKKIRIFELTYSARRLLNLMRDKVNLMGGRRLRDPYNLKLNFWHALLQLTLATLLFLEYTQTCYCFRFLAFAILHIWKILLPDSHMVHSISLFRCLFKCYLSRDKFSILLFKQHVPINL